MKTFNDIKFKLHPNGMGGILGQLELGNGYKISVVGGGRGLYGDGKKTFEVAVFDRMGEMIMLSENDQVLGWQTMDQVNEIIKKFDEEPVLKVKL
jgi:hypothetical protein